MVVAFAGYKKQMETLFEFNEGLPSRFPVILSFEDFADAQLCDIFCDLAKKNRFSFAGDDPKYARVVTKRLGKLRGTCYKKKNKFIIYYKKKLNLLFMLLFTILIQNFGLSYLIFFKSFIS